MHYEIIALLPLVALSVAVPTTDTFESSPLFPRRTNQTTNSLAPANQTVANSDDSTPYYYCGENVGLAPDNQTFYDLPKSLSTMYHIHPGTCQEIVCVPAEGTSGQSTENAQMVKNGMTVVVCKDRVGKLNPWAVPYKEVLAIATSGMKHCQETRNDGLSVATQIFIGNATGRNVIVKSPVNSKCEASGILTTLS